MSYPVFGSQYTVDENTIALWHLNENVGDVVFDESGINNGSLAGSDISWTSGLYGSGLQLFSVTGGNIVGRGSQITLPANLLSRTNFTVQMNIRWDYQAQYPITGDSYAGHIFSGGGSNTFARVHIVPDTDRNLLRLTFGVYCADGWVQITTPSNFYLQDNRWYNLAFTCAWEDIGGGVYNTVLKLYIDGVLAIEQYHAFGPFAGNGTPYIGRADSGLSFNGTIDEVRISDTARTDLNVNSSCGEWGYILGDFDLDCYVSILDLSKIADEWASCSSSLHTDIFYDGCIDFQDYSIFASNWGSCTEPEDNNCTPGYDKILNFDSDEYFCSLLIGSGLNDNKGLRWGKLYNKNTSTQYLYPADNTPLFMILGDGFMADSTDFVIDDIQYHASECHISLNSQPYQLTATMVVRTDESNKMRWSMNVSNAASTPRRIQPVFPFMGRIKIGNSLSENKYFYPWRGGIVGNVDCDLLYEYGGLAWMQVIAVFNPTLGVGLFTYPEDSTGRMKGMPFKKSYGLVNETIERNEIVLKRERPNTGDPTQPIDILSSVNEGVTYAYYYPGYEIASGAKYELPTTIISVYQGNWKEPLKDYSSWAHSSWYNHVNTPQWFKNCFNSVGAYPGYYYSESQNKYIRSTNMSNPDPMHLEQWAFWWDYSDINNPFGEAGDYYYNASRGGLTAFRNEIEAIQSKGGRVTVYIDHRFCWTESDIGSSMGQEWAVMNPPGVYPYYQQPDDKWLTCAYEPNAWADYLSQTCGRIIRDTGMDGIYLDELSLMFPCYNPNHVHYQEDKKPFSVSRMRHFLEQARAAIKSANTDAILMTEHAGSDYFSQFYDGSWDQTYYKSAFPHAQQYYDEYSISFFRFCFPEFKLIYWGPNDDLQRRAFFSGMGICDYPLSGYEKRTGQVLKENGDAFASLTPEPIIPTYVTKVLANKFPVDTKVLYTVYNKDTANYTGVPIMQVEHRSNYHYVELYNDSNFIGVNTVGDFDELTFTIDSKEVLCIAQLPRIIQASVSLSTLNLSLTSYQGDEILVVFWNYDNSEFGFGSGTIVDISTGTGQVTIPNWLGNGKAIIKLYRGDMLLDQVVLGGTDVSGATDIAIWNMNEGSGTVLIDSVGGDNNLQLGSQFYWTTSTPNNTPGYAISTPYYNNSYCKGFINPADITDKLSVSAWIRPVYVDGDGSYIVAMDQKFQLRISSSRSAIQFVVYTSDFIWRTVSAEPLGKGVSLIDGLWHHVRGVYDGEKDQNGNANLFLYWDDELIATVSFAIASEKMLLMDGGKGDIHIGSNLSGSNTANYNGALDDIKISNY